LILLTTEFRIKKIEERTMLAVGIVVIELEEEVRVLFGPVRLVVCHVLQVVVVGICETAVCLPRRKRSRSSSEKQSPDVGNKRVSSSLFSSSSSSSSSSSCSPTSSRSKVQKKDVSQEKPQIGDDEEEAANAAVELADAERIEGDVEEGCRECGHLLRDLKRHVEDRHARSSVATQKATIKAWFEAHYSRRANNAGENAAAVNRSTLLKEINSFLESMGWPTWKTQSPMYKDWFLREVMSLSDDDIKKQRNWSLFYKALPLKEMPKMPDTRSKDWLK
jgi:hypothetical protein